MTRNTALIYVRVSRLDEDERARKVSPDMQREKALALPELAGMAVEVFDADLNRSGKDTAGRPDYLRMLDRIAVGDVRYVVAYDLSRITRHVGDQQAFFDALQRHGAQFLSSSSGRTIDASNEDDEYVATIEGAGNQRERKKTARRIRDALATKVARGELVGPVPAGYMRRKEVLPSGRVARTWVEPDPERSPTIQLAFREYATGDYSFKTLARLFNARSIPVPRPPHFRNNRPNAEIWTADVLKDLLGNPRYVGRVPRRDGTEFPAAYPALIDEETWAACQRVRLAHRAKSWAMASLAHRPRVSRYLLSGVLHCAACGSSMSGETWKPDRTHPIERARYTCYRRRTAGLCSAPYIDQDELEGAIIDVLEAVSLPAGIAEAVDAAAAGLRRHAQPKRSSVREIEARLDRLRTLFEMGDVDLGTYTARRDALTAEKAEAAAPRRVPQLAKQNELLRSLVQHWTDMTTDERKRTIGHVFQEIRAERTDGEARVRFLPREDWRPYMRAAVTGGVAERKTGLKPLASPPPFMRMDGDWVEARHAA